MQEVATGKYHGHSFGGLNGVPPTDEIGRSVLSVRRTDANLYFVAMLLVSYWHLADIPVAPPNVRFWGYSGHQRALIQCLFLTQRRHKRANRILGRWVRSNRNRPVANALALQ